MHSRRLRAVLFQIAPPESPLAPPGATPKARVRSLITQKPGVALILNIRETCSPLTPRRAAPGPRMVIGALISSPAGRRRVVIVPVTDRGIVITVFGLRLPKSIASQSVQSPTPHK